MKVLCILSDVVHEHTANKETTPCIKVVIFTRLQTVENSKTIRPKIFNVVAVTYDRLFMRGSNYILYLVLCSRKRLPTSNILSVFTQTVFKQIEKAIFFFLSGYP